jgi:hypothetical protein
MVAGWLSSSLDGAGRLHKSKAPHPAMRGFFF